MAFSSGLSSPTVSESLRMRLVAEGGCVACLLFAGLVSPCEVHHLTVGGKHGAPRRGHGYTVGLCPWHHRGVSAGGGAAAMERELGPSYALSPVRFREMVGGDDGLLRLQARRLADVVATYMVSPGRYADPMSDTGLLP